MQIIRASHVEPDTEEFWWAYMGLMDGEVPLLHARIAQNRSGNQRGGAARGGHSIEINGLQPTGAGTYILV